MKQCTTCKVTKHTDEFYFRKDTGKYKTECKVCTVSRSKRNRKEDADVYDRERHLMQTYGLTLEDYDSLLISQEGCCAICNSPDPKGKGRFHVDHNHKTGEIRGLLCSTCNQGIGLLLDNPTILRKAAEYLETNGYYGD
jgi:hypothetical protein